MTYDSSQGLSEMGRKSVGNTGARDLEAYPLMPLQIVPRHLFRRMPPQLLDGRDRPAALASKVFPKTDELMERRPLRRREVREKVARGPLRGKALGDLLTAELRPMRLARGWSFTLW